MRHAQDVLTRLAMNGRKMSKSEVKIFDSRYLLTADGLAYKDGYKAAEGIVPFGYKVNEP